MIDLSDLHCARCREEFGLILGQAFVLSIFPGRVGRCMHFMVLDQLSSEHSGLRGGDGKRCHD